MQNNYRWFIIFLLFSISFINFLDRASFSYAIPIIGKYFSFSSSQQGILLSAFGMGYIFSTFLSGILVDKFGAKNTLSIGVIFWSLTIVCLGLSSSWIMFLIFRILFGLAEGPLYPSISKAIANWLPERERARAFTFSLISVPLSLGLGGVVIDYVINVIGWRWCFMALAFLTLAWLPFWYLFFANKPQESHYITKLELDYLHQPIHIESYTHHQKHPWKVLLTNPTLLSNYFGFFVFTFYLYFFMSWLPSYFLKAQHIEFKSLGIYSLFPWLTAAFLIWLFGNLSDKIFNSTYNLRQARSYLIIISQLLSGIFVLGVCFSTSFFGMMLCMCLTIGFAMAANAPFYSVNVDIAKERAGSAIGIMCAIGSLASIISPSISGFLLDWTGSFNTMFFFMSGLSFTSCLILCFFHNRRYQVMK